ncbi:MAG: transketolase [Magnetococcales bacterium]|nr:transketolase [Magnetococcales bacterium]
MTDPQPVNATATPPLDTRSRELRRLVVSALDKGGRGHPGSALSLIEILRVLYDDILHHKPDEPDWSGRDFLVLSKGHGCLGLYALLADHGYFDIQELERFCKIDSFLGGHPERGKIPGVEASTGALGHGLAIGIGLALAQRLKQKSNRVVVVLGDGEINEGAVWEGAMSAAKHRLENLTALIDYNKLQSYGPTREVMDLEPLADKWRAFGFETREVDGHDVEALKSTLSELPFTPGKPSALICHTVKGKGLAIAENNPTWHHKSYLDATAIQSLYDSLEGA